MRARFPQLLELTCSSITFASLLNSPLGAVFKQLLPSSTQPQLLLQPMVKGSCSSASRQQSTVCLTQEHGEKGSGEKEEEGSMAKARK